MTQGIMWQKSSFSSGGDSGNCVELATVDRTLLLRESEAPARALSPTPAGLAALIRHVRAQAD